MLDDKGGLRATLEFYGVKAFEYTRPDAGKAVAGESLELDNDNSCVGSFGNAGQDGRKSVPTIEHEKKGPVTRRKGPGLRPADEHDLFAIVWPYIEKELDTPKTEQELADKLKVRRGQMQDWLKKAQELGKVHNCRVAPHAGVFGKG